MVRRRYYTCPKCGGPTMTGYVDVDGRERWVCLRAEGCDGCDWPTDAPVRLRTAPVQPHDPATPRRERAQPRGFARSAALRPSRSSGRAEVSVPTPRPAQAPWYRTVASLAVIVGLAVILVVGSGWWVDHSPRSVYSYTSCRDGWISHSIGPGTCSHHHGVAQYVYVQVTAPPDGWSSVN